MKIILKLAGLYNIIWGTWVVLFPKHIFLLTNTQLPKYVELWQCVGMIVAVYGVGYWIAADSPLKHWPIILVGFLGKLFGPIGFLVAIQKGVFPLTFGWNIVFNDLIWWVPFGLILYRTFKARTLPASSPIEKQNFEDLSQRDRARFINSLSGFKSANLIGTKDNKGQTNLCIISSAFHLGANPPLIGFIIRPDSVPRDSLINIRESKTCTLNHVNKEILYPSHQTSARYPKDLSEFDACHLGVEYKDGFHAPFVKEANIKMALKVLREEKLPENGTHLIITEIEAVYAPKNCVKEDGSIDIQKAGSLAVAGLDTYFETNKIARLSYAKPGKPLTSMEE